MDDASLFLGDRVTRFQFDWTPAAPEKGISKNVLLTFETEAGDISAWAIGRPLVERLIEDLTRETQEQGHSITSLSKEIRDYLSLPLLQSHKVVWSASQIKAPQIIHLNIHATHYSMDVSCLGEEARRISLSPAMTVVFISQREEMRDS
ncbi:hypothetical protein NY99_22050 [Xanthomonas phaseoli pv. phaseoli]|uniref:hypothetical protein n=1 Tax=Xanthomonas phaseoli TaxID=1985254 RepID=UPI00053918BF|nr:hypothetical protein [Xanthomonas phaseoli]KGU50345.1 hypothetical protein NY99_22050 [Xanthomonas phaseoli pv. phaseoli]KHF46883.1 hypothetical protein QQ30_19325 [Xanthomonas phaseoli pv. phaseoli]KHS21243.1 hypothetical protein RM60_21930 [Xanthomonas phaseoli pv. phaseoli]